MRIARIERRIHLLGEMRTAVPAVVSKLETCEQETGWVDFISIEISKKALFCPPTLF